MIKGKKQYLVGGPKVEAVAEWLKCCDIRARKSRKKYAESNFMTFKHQQKPRSYRKGNIRK